MVSFSMNGSVTRTISYLKKRNNEKKKMLPERFVQKTDVLVYLEYVMEMPGMTSVAVIKKNKTSIFCN